MLFVGHSSFHEIPFWSNVQIVFYNFACVSMTCLLWRCRRMMADNAVYESILLCFSFQRKRRQQKTPAATTTTTPITLSTFSHSRFSFFFSFSFAGICRTRSSTSTRMFSSLLYLCRVYPVPLYASLGSLLLLFFPLFSVVIVIMFISYSLSWNLSIIRRQRRKKLNTFFFFSV